MLAYRLSVVAFVTALSTSAQAQSIAIDTSAAGRQQTIDGFGTCLSGTEGQETWFQDLYFGDMQCSMLRLDLTPKFKPPYSDNQYNSPGWNQAGPDGTFVRSYTTASDYKRTWNGNAAQIAVMGPDIEKNVDYFDYADDMPKTAGELAKVGDAKKVELGDFKLFAAIGAWLGWQMLPLVLLLSAVVGAAVGLTLIVMRRHGREVPIPFGPYLAGAGWIAMLWGPQIVARYLIVAGLN